MKENKVYKDKFERKKNIGEKKIERRGKEGVKGK